MNSSLKNLSIEALKALARDLRAQVNSGLLSNKEAHDKINIISAVIMQKEIEKIEAEDDAEKLMSNDEYDNYLFSEKDGISEGDDLMTNGRED